MTPSLFEQIFYDIQLSLMNELIEKHIEQAYLQKQYINVHTCVLDMAKTARLSVSWHSKAFVILLFALCCQPFRDILFEHMSTGPRDLIIMRIEHEFMAWFRGLYLHRRNALAKTALPEMSSFADAAPAYMHTGALMTIQIRTYALQL